MLFKVLTVGQQKTVDFVAYKQKAKIRYSECVSLIAMRDVTLFEKHLNVIFIVLNA